MGHGDFLYLGTPPGPSELFALRWERVDFDAGTVRIDVLPIYKKIKMEDSDVC